MIVVADSGPPHYLILLDLLWHILRRSRSSLEAALPARGRESRRRHADFGLNSATSGAELV